MTATTATYSVTRTPLDAEQYRVALEITGTTNGLDLELFVFETSSDIYVSVATRFALEAYPNDKQQAVDGGISYYRGAAMIRDLPTVEAAEAFVTGTLTRIENLCRSVDNVAIPFTGTATGTLPT